MIFIKKYLYPVFSTLLITLLGSFLITILYYFNMLSNKMNTILLYLVSIIAMFTGAYLLGKNLKYKGIITGAFYFLAWLIIMVMLSLLFFKVNLNFSSIIYYFVIMMFSVLGGIIGKNSKEETDV